MALTMEASERPREMLRGVDWGVVELDCSGELDISPTVLGDCGREGSLGNRMFERERVQ